MAEEYTKDLPQKFLLKPIDAQDLTNEATTETIIVEKEVGVNTQTITFNTYKPIPTNLSNVVSIT